MAGKYQGIDDTKIEQKREERKEVRYEKRELRRVLLGITHRNEEGRLVPSDQAVAINRYGLEDGAVQLLFLGIMRRRKRYTTKLRMPDFIDAADKAMANIGNRVVLQQTPGLPAVFRRFRLSVPALLFLETEGDEIIVNTVSARDVTGLRATRVLRKAFEKEMGTRLVPVQQVGKTEAKKKPAKDGKK